LAYEDSRNPWGLPWTEIQLEDMESYAFNLEHLLRIEMDTTDDAKQLLQEREEKIEQLEDIIQKLKDKKKTLEAANDKLTYKTEDQETQIAGL
jgi:DNA repair exonuclease SbcCD ATPase subunit